MNQEVERHPEIGDTLVLTDIVHERAIIGTGLPCGFKLQNQDQTFDEYHVEVVDILQVHKDWQDDTSPVVKEELTLKKPNGETTKALYKGKEPICGNVGESIRVSNSQGATQAYNWKQLE